MKFTILNNFKGVALVTALIIVAVVMMLIMSTLYVITNSTIMSGAGKRYATACEAADGSVQIAKEAVVTFWRDGELPSVIPTGPCEGGVSYDLGFAIQNINNKCTKTLTLSNYNASITIEYLYSMGIAGNRIEFPPRFVGGMSGVGLYYRITTQVTDSKSNASCENSVLYRFTG